MRDTRYVLTRRRSGRFEHVRPEGFKHVDAIERRWERQSRRQSYETRFSRS